MKHLDKLMDTIRNQEFFDGSLPAGFDGIWDWSFLNKHYCFGVGTSITPMDLDAIIERNGRFIVFETKGSIVDSYGNISPIPIPKGQQLTLAALFKLGCVTQVIIRCDVGKKHITSFQYRFPNDNTFTKMTLGNVSSADMQKEIAKIVKMWYRDADQSGGLSIKAPIVKQAPVVVEKPLTFTDKVCNLFKSITYKHILKLFKLKRI